MNHLALVIPGLDRIGGAERQVALLAKGLVQRGWRVTVVALSGDGGEAAGELTAAGVSFLTLRMRKGLADPRGWASFHRWLRREAPEVVHAHLPHAVWLARWSRLAAPVRVLVDTLHSTSTGTLGRRLGDRSSLWLTDRVTAVSQAVAHAHLAAATVHEDKLTVLPNGVDEKLWRPDAAVRAGFRRELGLGEEFFWFAAGRLEPVKDYPTLLAAMAEVPARGKLVIAGGGRAQNDLLRQARSLGISDRVRFLGFEPDVLRWMRAADGFVLSSRWEGLPMGLLEAAACALPAVATDVPGTREVLVNGQTGLLAAAGCAAGLAAALAAAMTRMMQLPPHERRAMGERARQRVMEHYSLEAVLSQWEDLYASHLEGNPLPGRWGTARPARR